MVCPCRIGQGWCKCTSMTKGSSGRTHQLAIKSLIGSDQIRPTARSSTITGTGAVTI